MGIWSTHVVPRIVDKALAGPQERAVRERVCAGLRGDVLEIGFGSGHNLPYLPPSVTSLAAVEPSGVGVRLAAERLAESPVPVTFAGLDGQRIEADDESYDAVLSTWTLCTIPDVRAALAEVRRVLRPGGTFHFAEHGLAPDDGVATWQRRLDPVQKRVAGGCHLSRPIEALVRDAGFGEVRVERYYQPKMPKAIGSMYEGVAGDVLAVE
ncbi:MAG TPA: class I SAM-dependent methyltransferase [Frankiaceae bacterium]|nr:class I SAM-dependent methyltransferase [Frankiaceae bacterium]